MRVSMKLGIVRFAEVNLTMPFMAYHSPKSVKCMRVSMKLGIVRFAEVNLTMPFKIAQMRHFKKAATD